ncbi:SDR family oxidoreductase [Tepidiphilus sp. J10]|uniref:SDR family oxidoreductase n=1 Tax=Tepidiphilus sp. J10 TaxID=2502185 RepID=UPI00115CC00C|nr:SDR family oxidoreductase [Tepidiphilus sp. J10]
MDLGLQGKKAVVSGSTSGIGFATAKALAREGAEVVINGRSPQRVEAAIARLRAEVPQARLIGVAADLSTAEGCEALLHAVPQTDVLEEAAAAQGVSVEEVEREFFRTMRPTSLIRRFARPDEVAAMIAYVCSAAASATTGAALRVDGGVVRSIV